MQKKFKTSYLLEIGCIQEKQYATVRDDVIFGIIV